MGSPNPEKSGPEQRKVGTRRVRGPEGRGPKISLFVFPSLTSPVSCSDQGRISHKVRVWASHDINGSFLEKKKTQHMETDRLCNGSLFWKASFRFGFSKCIVNIFRASAQTQGIEWTRQPVVLWTNSRKGRRAPLIEHRSCAFVLKPLDDVHGCLAARCVSVTSSHCATNSDLLFSVVWVRHRVCIMSATG